MEEKLRRKVTKRAAHNFDLQHVDVRRIKKLFEEGKLSFDQLLSTDTVKPRHLSEVSPNKIADIRNFFLANEKIKLSKKSEEAKKLSLKTSQDLKKRATSQVKRPKLRVAKTVRSQTVKRKRHASVNLEQNKLRCVDRINSVNASEDQEQDQDRDSDFHTPNITPDSSFDMGKEERVEKEQEDQLLQVIAHQMQQRHDKKMEEDSQSSVNQSDSEAETSNQGINEKMETTDIDDPQALSYANVIEMFRQLKKELKEEVRSQVSSSRSSNHIETSEEQAWQGSIETNSKEIDNLKEELGDVQT